MLAATFITVAIPYVVTVLLPAVELPARYKLTPVPPAIVMLAVPRFTIEIAVPTGQTTDVLLAMVSAKFDALVE
jgi:hypothetical protein